jgi:hypothetical protein
MHNMSGTVKSQLSKTAYCKFHAVGRCTKGEQCPYAHDAAEIRPAPDLTKTKLCKAWTHHKCRSSSDLCPFAHGAHELRKTDAVQQLTDCKPDVEVPPKEKLHSFIDFKGVDCNPISDMATMVSLVGSLHALQQTMNMIGPCTAYDCSHTIMEALEKVLIAAMPDHYED